MSFTDQLPRIAAEKDVMAPWGGDRSGNRFRCYLCGNKFKVGDQFRWVMSTPRNFMTCGICDGDDVQERFAALCAEFKAMKDRCWWASVD